MHMATFTIRTHLLAALLVAVSAVIMHCSVNVCHGAREGWVDRILHAAAATFDRVPRAAAATIHRMPRAAATIDRVPRAIAVKLYD
ncbi:hypothetical protein E2562_022633 [Oryza meyeriana var. granulata]|uniref:Secreted protein n=1 Tax=Oryza meyeriana var. granulata TaxID=110450 RepID=A0A6G1CRB2_9ORYZ|nr:hypothetical protein E2562_022633 [Oryza meyeriana var. granulata]